MAPTPPATDQRLMSDADLATIADYFETHETTTGREMLTELFDQIKALTADLDRRRQERTDAERVVMLIEKYLITDGGVSIDGPACHGDYCIHPVTANDEEQPRAATLLAALEAAAAAKGESP